MIKLDVSFRTSPLNPIEPQEGVWCEVHLHTPHRPRWRMIEKAYRLMGTSSMNQLIQGKTQEAVTEDGYTVVKVGTNF